MRIKLSVKLLTVLVILIIVGTQSICTLTLAQGAWTTIKTFTGTGYKDTEDLTVPVKYWRFRYMASATSEQYAMLSIFLYPSGETKSYVTFVELRGSGTDVNYVHVGLIFHVTISFNPSIESASTFAITS